MNAFHTGLWPLGEISWRTGSGSADYRRAGENLAQFFQWLASLSATGWLLIALAIGLGIFYWWCLGRNLPRSDVDTWEYWD